MSCWKNAVCSISDFISCASLLLNAGFALKDVQEWIGQSILRGWLTFTGTWTRPGSRARRKNASEASSSDVRNVLEKSGQIKAGTKRKSPKTLRFQDFFWPEWRDLNCMALCFYEILLYQTVLLAHGLLRKWGSLCHLVRYGTCT